MKSLSSVSSSTQSGNRKNQNGKSNDKKRNIDDEISQEVLIEHGIIQEKKLIEFTSEVLLSAMKKSIASEQKHEENIHQNELSINETKKELEAAHITLFGTSIGSSSKAVTDGNDEKDDNGDFQQNENVESPLHKPINNLNSEIIESISENDASKIDPEAQKEYQKKKQKLAELQKSKSSNRRERSTLSSSLRWMLEEALQSQYLVNLLPPDCIAALNNQLNLFCTLEDMFFIDQKSFDNYLLQEHKILGSQFLRYSPSDPRSKEYRPNISQPDIDCLNSSIDQYLNQFEPDSNFYISRRNLLLKLQAVLDEIGAKNWCKGGAKLMPFGSSANGFAEINSDLDMCLKLDNGWDKHFTAVEIIEKIAEKLKLSGFSDIDDERKTARIPLIRFTDTQLQGIHCDICINNSVSLF